MSRVLLTGATGPIGTAVVRRLLADPQYELRISDRRPAPRWMREGCEVHGGELRVPSEARKATAGCTHVIHLQTILDGERCGLPHTLIEASNALSGAVIGAAIDLEVERFTYVSSSLVFERASEFPTTEAYLSDCPTPRSAYGFSQLVGEAYCRAAHDEHGLQYTICRPFDAYGPREAPEAEPGIAQAIEEMVVRTLSGQRPLLLSCAAEQTRTPTHVDDVADGIVTAMSSPQGRNEDFNIAASRELTVAEIARIAWQACGEDEADFASEQPASVPVNVARRWPSVEKAAKLLGWQARIEPEEGIAATVEWIRERGSIGSLP
jgi:UDP-glucose 4-epimerase